MVYSGVCRESAQEWHSPLYPLSSFRVLWVLPVVLASLGLLVLRCVPWWSSQAPLYSIT